MLAVTDAAREALQILRDGSTFEWSTVAFLAFVFYVYAVEVERRRWDIILAGLAFWLMDWFNELANSAIFHASDRAPLWTVTGDTSYLLLIGLSIEISFLFLVAGVIFVKQLPPDPKLKVFGVNNRLLLSSPSPVSACWWRFSSTQPVISRGSTGGGTFHSCR